ncbi:hypothetical protein G3A49_11970 [Haloferax volcanii]|uniref:Uncharacterized protein n=1 Tax=Haloferax volcanii TaxID=2246 RepID=A0A558GA54_HALVO|nr:MULTISPECIES: hypothetical protein [Haloferax]QIB78815.1 hypothetical protein G3A49_11970 [Haloferax alexandrinus]TVT94648.1 hypothetical protein FQA18_10720 [Haloferax volcanii]
MTDELREFVYLDSMSVNSLLASQYMAVPETVRDVSEDIEGDDSQKGLSGSIGFQGIGSIGGNWKSGDSEQSRRMSETEQRINDQYRFSMLYKTLKESDQLTNLSEAKATDTTSLELSQGQVVKVTGNCETDPLYRLLSAISLMMRFTKAEQMPQDEFDTNDLDDITLDDGNSIFALWKEILHGEQIGLKIDPDGFRYPVIMSVGIENMWVNPEREFLGAQNYTVVGRVTQVNSGNEAWDFIDLLKIFRSVFSDESVDKFRDSITEVGEKLNQSDNGEFQIDVEINREDYVVEEPAVIIDPIAIYW